MSSHILDFCINLWKEEYGLYNIKNRLADLGKSQVWLLKKLRDKGFNTQPPQLSNIINGNYTYPKAQSVLEECNNILTEFEQNIGAN